MAKGLGERELLAGDRVVFVVGGFPYQGIIEKVNSYKSIVKNTDKDWTFYAGSHSRNIENRKIFKVNE